MTRSQIIKTISQIPSSRIKTIHVKCRPPEKSDAVLVVKVDKHNWYCERPKYFWSTFDRTFVEKPYLEEQKSLYPKIKEPLTAFDTRGLFWQRAEMSSFGLVKLFLQKPQLYLQMMARHTTEASQIAATLKKIRPTLSDPRKFSTNLKIFINLYRRMYLAQCTIYMTFDELVYQFRQLLLKYLPKETVNTYFPKFLAGNATKHALAKDYVSGRGNLEYQTTRGVLYAMGLKPRAFYVAPHYFPDFSDDAEIIEKLIQAKIADADLQKYFAFRIIVPLGFQINEESQYIETVGLSAHLGVLMKAIGRKTKTPLENFQKMNLKPLLKLI